MYLTGWSAVSRSSFTETVTGFAGLTGFAGFACGTGSGVRAGFAAETENAHENARKKLESKSLDAIVLNDV